MIDELLMEVMESIKEVNFIIQEMEENDELMDCELGEGYCPYLEIRGSDMFFEVRYLNFQIWSSDEDGRDEIVEKMESGDPVLEPMLDYLKRKVNSISKLIGKIKV
jgi:hypothetical protein